MFPFIRMIAEALISRAAEVAAVPAKHRRSTEEWLQDSMRTWVYGLVAAAVVIVTLSCLVWGVTSVPLLRDRPGDWSLIVGVVLALAFVGVAGLVALWVLWTLARRKVLLDAAFVPLGLVGGPYLLNGRHYAGEVGGRRVDVWSSRGSAMDVYVSATTQTRAGLRRSPHTVAAPPSTSLSPEEQDRDLSSIRVSAHDENWLRTLLSEPLAERAIQDLLTQWPAASNGRSEVRQVSILPDAVCLSLYNMRLGRLTPDMAQAWLTDLLAVARLAEALPPTAKRLIATDDEQNARLHRQAIGARNGAVTCAFVVAFAIFLVWMIWIAVTTGGT